MTTSYTWYNNCSDLANKTVFNHAYNDSVVIYTEASQVANNGQL